MPRTKKFRFTTAPRRATVSGRINDADIPSPIRVPLPMMVCVVCYNEFTSYSLNCIPWETAVTKDFYVALNITNAQVDESVVSLPFCPECHSKVAVMYSNHQQLQSILQNFNSLRNDLAFTVVETIEKNCRKGPLDLIRRQIFDRWKDLHAEAKEANSVDVYDTAATSEYLEPHLTKMADWPLNSKSMKITHLAKQKLTEETSQEASSPVKVKTPRPNITAAKKLLLKGKANNIRKVGKRNLEMPKLEPMGSLPSKPSATVASVSSTISAARLNGSLRKSPKLSKKNLLQKQAAKLKQNRLKKSTWGGNKNQTMAYKKPAKRLADGSWQCGYCPMSYSDRTRVRQHEGRCHPNTRPLICHICPKGFLSIDTLRRHLSTTHDQVLEGFKKCPYCFKSFAKQKSFDQHLRNVHKQKKIKIPPKTVKPAITTSVNTSKKLQSLPGKAVKSLPSTSVKSATVKVPMVSPPSPEITDLSAVAAAASRANSPQEKNGLENSRLGKRKLSKEPKTSLKKEKRDTLSINGEKTEKIIQNGDQSRSREVDVYDFTDPPVSHNGPVNGTTISTTSQKQNVKASTFDCTKCSSHFGTNKELQTHTCSQEESESSVESSDDNEEEEQKEIETNSKSKPKGGRPKKTRFFPKKPKRTSHTRIPIVNLRCPICKKKFNKIQAVAGHMKLHKRDGSIMDVGDKSVSIDNGEVPVSD